MRKFSGIAGINTDPSGNIGITAICSPTPRSGSALEGSNNVAGYPAAIEVALLSLNDLIPNPALIHPAGIERNLAGKVFKAFGWILIRPGRSRYSICTDDNVEIACSSLELAMRLAFNRNQYTWSKVRNW